MILFGKNTRRRSLLLLFFAFSIFQTAHGQRLVVLQTPDGTEVFTRWDTLRATAGLERRAWEYIQAGHIFAMWDTVVSHRDSLVIQMIPGTQYSYSNPPPSPKSRQLMLKPYVNAGYPFAAVVLDSVVLEDRQVSATYRVDSGPEILFDSVSQRRSVGLSETFLYRTLGFQRGDPYSERVFKGIPARIKGLRQVELLSPPDVGFESGRATVFLDLRDRRADSFEGIIGLLNDQDRGTTVTGYLRLDLTNLFSSGKELHIDWNRFAASSQDLDLQYAHPYIFGSDFRLSAGLAILRQDSAFVKRDFSFAVDFPLSGAWYFGVGFGRHASDLLGAEPDISQGLDYANNGYSAQVRWRDRLDDMNAYQNYMGAIASLEVGDKRIRSNAQIDPEVYDTLQLRSTNYQWDLDLAAQWIFARQSAVFGRLQAGTVRGPQIVRNEYYRVGGLRSFRGFNENEFFARSLVKLQTEYRLYYDSSSYLLALVDMGVIQTEWDEKFLAGYGLGVAIDTQAGNFQLIFALGNSNDTPADVRNVKAHFGYSVTF